MESTRNKFLHRKMSSLNFKTRSNCNLRDNHTVDRQTSGDITAPVIQVTARQKTLPQNATNTKQNENKTFPKQEPKHDRGSGHSYKDVYFFAVFSPLVAGMETRGQAPRNAT